MESNLQGYLQRVHKTFRDKNWNLYRCDWKSTMDDMLGKGHIEELKLGLYLPFPAVPENDPKEIRRVMDKIHANPRNLVQYEMLNIDNVAYPLFSPVRFSEDGVLMADPTAMINHADSFAKIPYERYISSLERLTAFPVLFL